MSSNYDHKLAIAGEKEGMARASSDVMGAGFVDRLEIRKPYKVPILGVMANQR